MRDMNNYAYQHAFANYLRQGIPIERTLSTAQHPTSYYIWRTRGDGKVRKSHTANNGKIFAWENPPKTGHPGEDYNCRCIAEAYTSIVPAALLQWFRNTILDPLANSLPWGNAEMSLYFFLGNGEPINIEAIGHAVEIQDYYTQHYLHRFEEQIRNRAATSSLGAFSDEFDRSYNFIGVRFSYGESRIIGHFEGNISETTEGGRSIQGMMTFTFRDSFKDPLDIAQLIINLRNSIPLLENITEEQLYSWFREATNLWQKPYTLTGNWEESYSAPL